MDDTVSPLIDDSPVSSPPTSPPRTPTLLADSPPPYTDSECSSLPPKTLKTLSWRGYLLLASLSFSCISLNLNTYIGSTFFVIHFQAERDVAGTILGLIAAGIGIGCVIAPIFDVAIQIGLAKLKIKMNSKYLLVSFLVVFIVFSVGFSISDSISNKHSFSLTCLSIRIVLGVLTALIFRAQIDCVRVWFPGKFVLINSLVTGTSCYVGITMATAAAGSLYEKWGFVAPYAFAITVMACAMACCIIFIPRDTTPFIPEPPSSVEDLTPLMEEEEDEEPLTKLVVVPLFGQLLINSCGPYILMVTTPYLKQCCSISIAKASLYVMMYPISVAVGFFVGGFIGDRKILSVGKQCILGGSMVSVGLLLAFYTSTMDSLYTNSQYLSWVGIVLAGLGDPICSCITLKYMESMQTNIGERHLSHRQKNVCDTLWVLGWNAGSSLGFLAAGSLLQQINNHHAHGSWMMSSVGVTGVAIFVCLQICEGYVERKRKRRQRLLEAGPMVKFTLINESFH
eukprot:sb/3463965/